MIYNDDMKKIVSQITVDEIINKKEKLIKRKKTKNEEEYFVMSKGFCLSNVKNIYYTGSELSEFEWEGNEIYINYITSLTDLLRQALIVVKKLRLQMENDFKGNEFDIVAYLDLGDEDVEPSATVRFYKVRDNYHIILKDEINNWSQPVLLDNVIHTK